MNECMHACMYGKKHCIHKVLHYFNISLENVPAPSSPNANIAQGEWG